MPYHPSSSFRFQVTKSLSHRIAIALITFAICISTVQSVRAQLVVDLKVKVTEFDGRFRYDYTLKNEFLSTLNVNAFLLSVSRGAEIDGIDQLDGWVGEYAKDELNFQVGWVNSLPGFFEIEPGQSGNFSLSSSYGPGEQDYSILKLTSDGLEVLDVVDGSILAPTLSATTFEVCDFNEDGFCDLTDINQLGRQIALQTNSALYDLTGDELVNVADLNAFLADPNVNKFNGDLDFNGKVEFADFLVLSTNFGATTARWSEGDLVPNSQVEFADFLALSSNFGKTSVGAAQLANVPEPGFPNLVLLCITLCPFLRPALLRSRRMLYPC